MSANQNTITEDSNSGIGNQRLSEKAYDTIWKIVTISFAIVLFVSVVSIAITLFYCGGCRDIDKVENGRQTLLTMFSSAVGFLAGLFIPSPVSNRKGNS